MRVCVCVCVCVRVCVCLSLSVNLLTKSSLLSIVGERRANGGETLALVLHIASERIKKERMNWI